MNNRKGDLFNGARTIGMVALAIGVSTLWATAKADAMQPYTSLENAAKAALIDAETLTGDYEAGGTIYQCGASFAYIAPVTDHATDHVGVTVYKGEGCTLAGMYHTHPKGDARYSSDDIRAACAADVVSFIKPHGGSVRAFDCRGMSYAARKVALSRPITGVEVGL